MRLGSTAWIAALLVAGCIPPEDVPPSGIADASDGWDDPPGTGLTFIASSLDLLRPGLGFDLDGRCGAWTCQDNLLGELYFYVEDTNREAIVQGSLRLMVEVAGLDDPTRWEDPRVTVKIYPVVDEDDPPRTGNDFALGFAGDPCCRFRPAPDAFDPLTRQPATRLAARLVAGQVLSVGEGQLWIPLGFGPGTGRLDRARVQLALQGEIPGLVEATLGGAVSAGFARTAVGCLGVGAPFCNGPEDNLLDLLAALTGSPDIDLDGDGLERIGLGADRSVTACYDGCVGVCAHVPPLAPPDPDDPASCLDLPDLADGYSAAYQSYLVEATLIQ